MKIVSHIGFHKDIFKPSLLKSTAVFLVFVFAWTNLGIYQAVYAATTSSSQHPGASRAGTTSLSLRGEAEAISYIVERLPRTLRVLAMTVKKRRCRKNRSI